MSGNSFGKLFTVTTAGESHGEALVALLMVARLAWTYVKPIFKGILI